MVCKPWLAHPWPRPLPPRTPQTPLKHYPRADALGKSDASDHPSFLPSSSSSSSSRILILRPGIIARARAQSTTATGYACTHSNLHFVAVYLSTSHDRTPLSSVGRLPLSLSLFFLSFRSFGFVFEVKKLAHASECVFFYFYSPGKRGWVSRGVCRF